VVESALDLGAVERLACVDESLLSGASVTTSFVIRPIGVHRGGW